MEPKKMKVLVVEDNPGDVNLLQEAFKEYAEGEFECVNESSLKSALKRLSEDEIDVILLDLSLPETSGLETLNKVQEADSKTPVVVLTGAPNEKMALQALQNGVQGYFLKGQWQGDALMRALCYSAESKRYGMTRKLQTFGEDSNRSRGALIWPGSKKKKEANQRNDGNGKKDSEETEESDGVNLLEIIEKEKVEAHFQPWISLRGKNVVGIEGLCRGTRDDSENLIPPAPLLRLAGRQRLLNALNRLFRKKILESFEPIAHQDPDLALSLNFDAAALDGGESGFEDFPSTVQKHHLDPGHIVIEIFESRPCELAHLKKFIEEQRNLGFLIALDNIQLDSSNLDAIAELKPDIIKTDRALVVDIDKKYYKQEMFKSLVNLAHGIGALLVAEGVETEMEAMLSLNLGADMIQGFYFSEPQKMREGFLSDCVGRIEEASRKFTSHAQSINIKRSLYQKHVQMIRLMSQKLSSATPQTFDIKLLEILERQPEVERMFILDKEGMQLSRMVSQGPPVDHRKIFFKPTERGADHTLRDYYYYLIKSYRKEFTFFTEPYLSTASGELCITLSTLFKDAYGHTSVLCADVKPERLSV